jgi:hypothetical protein
MTFSNYQMIDIEWPMERDDLPPSAVVAVPSSLWSLGAEDFEPDGALDPVEEMDEDEAEEFWDEYEPSEAACDALDAAWASELKRLLLTKFGVEPRRIGSFQPEVV